MENPNYFAILTADVRYSDKINANEKLLYAEITALSNRTGICWASNNYFAELYNCTPQAISKWIKNLQLNNFISLKYYYKSGSKEIEKREIKCVNIKQEGINNGIKGINNDLGGYKHTVKDNITSINNINYLYKNKKFIDIKNFNEYLEKFEFNKDYLKIARRFWKLWIIENPQHETLRKANIVNWYECIRLIIEVDNQKIDRLIAIYEYFKKCQQKQIGYRDFWFKTVKSMGGLRSTNSNGEYRLDKIADEVNEKMEKDDAFNRLVIDAINNFKKYTNESN